MPTLSTIARMEMSRLLPRTSFSLYLMSVMIVSWVGGTRPGLIATGLSLLASLWFFLPPDNSIAITSMDTAVQVLVFLLAALVIVFLNHSLRSSQQAAERLSESKARFLAHVTHELRTPLNGILGAAHLLNQSAKDPEQQKWISTIRASGENLLELLDSILTYSAAEVGKIPIRNSAFDLPSLLQECASTIEPLAQQKGIVLKVEADQVAKQMIADPIRLRQILLNLMGNAVKFTHRGEIKLKVAPAPLRNQKDMIRFEVSDTGVGIHPKAQALLFNPFSRGDDSVSSRYEGSGLGLAYSKLLTERMGGSIGCRSKLGTGSLFWFQLPLQAELDRDPFRNPRAARRTKGSPTKPQSGSILVVDDNEVNRLVVTRLLETLGFEAEAASSGEEALVALASRRTFCLVLMDLRMPGLDGFQTASRISSAVPIAAMTADVTQKTIERCRSVGMIDILEKPVSPETLDTLCSQFALKQGRAEEPSEATLEQLQEEVASLFFAALPGRMENLQAALDEKDSRKIGMLAHTLRSAAALIGEDDLATECEKVERLADTPVDLELFLATRTLLDGLAELQSRRAPQIHFSQV